ncbi:MAG: acyclic terpene utilization AtuA family protein [Acidimicrobiales bacterium]
MAAPIRIANCSGFYGDRLSAAREMVEDGPIDVLTGDWLAELTMLILARRRAKAPAHGYAPTFLTQMEQVLGTCLDRGIRVVTNAGGLDPDRLADDLATLAARLGLAPRIAYVSGDDLVDRLDELAASGTPVRDARDGTPLARAGTLTANAYLGAFGIVEALARGADVVVTGRVTDAALTCGPAAWHHGWARDDYDALAGAVVAGHILECGAQATGGNYSFFREVPGLEHVGFPWAEVAADGSSVIGKHDGTGGEVSVGTVTSQLLYEIDSPRYLGPDVVARFDTVEVRARGRDRVQVSGVRGEPPPPTLKVACTELGGYRQDLEVALTGLDVEAKATLVESAFWHASPYGPREFDRVTTHLARTEKVDPATNEEAVALWRITLRDRDEAKVGRALADAAIGLALATIPGFFFPGRAPGAAEPVGIYRPGLVPADLVPQLVTVLGEQRTVVAALVAPARAADPEPAAAPSPELAAEPCARVPLGEVVGARSGDKGGDANLGVFARSPDAWTWLDAFLTVERLAQLLPEVARHRVARYRLANLHALNFVIEGLLEEGVSSSSRQDRQAKGLGEWLRSRVVDVPVRLLA